MKYTIEATLNEIKKILSKSTEYKNPMYIKKFSDTELVYAYKYGADAMAVLVIEQKKNLLIVDVLVKGSGTIGTVKNGISIRYYELSKLLDAKKIQYTMKQHIDLSRTGINGSNDILDANWFKK